MEIIDIEGLRVNRLLYDLVQEEITPGTGIKSNIVWRALSDIVAHLGTSNRELLHKRQHFESQMNRWHREHRNGTIDYEKYETFLREIGYITPEADKFDIRTENIDAEIASIAGPQLVVPADNARYALNAANARWGSLYDAFYGTDVIADEGGAERGEGFNAVRGDKVVARTEALLDRCFALDGAKYSEVAAFSLANCLGSARLIVQLRDGRRTALMNPGQFAGYLSNGGDPSSVFLVNNGLHVEIQIDRNHPIGQQSAAGIKDVVLESAITTIQDCEDSVTAVDAEDKVSVYRNWLGLMKGTLTANFQKGARDVVRTLNPDKIIRTPNGAEKSLSGRSLLLVRNVGMHMYTDVVTTSEGFPIPEGFLDALMTSLAAIHDIHKLGRFANSRSGSIYIVKPKLHGPEEVALTVSLFSSVEKALRLPPRSIKIGIMDEEHRTSLNLKACIRNAQDRIVFINTGFLDRTADDIHTTMEAGPIIPKMEIKTARWLLAYEDRNVDIGISCGLPGKGQIGKGMWTMPGKLRAMLESKGAQLEAGANTSWVPSPIAATLHALHFHQFNVRQRQKELVGRSPKMFRELLVPPLLGDRALDRKDVQRELDNNAQGILGYVVRWVEQGVGCSKVPDIDDVELMEDRATLRISSQHIANWLHHGVLSKQEVVDSFKKMAVVVDRQNAHSQAYRNMAPRFDESDGFQAALDLVFSGRDETNGYTENALFRARRAFKRKRSQGTACG